jgi:hypothetical protein
VSGSAAETETAERAAGEDTGGRSPRWRIAARAATVAIIAAIVVVYRHHLRQSLDVLGHLSWKWFLLAIAAETASVLAFAFSRRRLLQAGGRPPSRRAIVAITCAGNAVSMSLPFAGTGLATVYSYRQFRRQGIDSATTGWTLAVSGIFSTSSLALLMVAGAIAGRSIATAAGFAGATVYLVPGAAVLLAVRYDRVRKALSQFLVRVAHGLNHLPRRWAARRARAARPASRLSTLEDFPARVEDFLDRIASISLPRRGYAEVFGLAVLNWLADCAALAFAILATGQPVPWHGLLLAYGAGAAVGSTGLTPGGFGLVELALAAALTAGGLAGSAALAAVIAYRLVNFWLIILTGWIVMLVHGDRPKALGRARLAVNRFTERKLVTPPRTSPQASTNWSRTPIPPWPACVSRLRWRGCRPWAAGWSPATQPRWRSCATTGRSPSTIPASPPRGWSGRACCRWTARPTPGTGPRSPARSTTVTAAPGSLRSPRPRRNGSSRPSTSTARPRSAGRCPARSPWRWWPKRSAWATSRRR